MKRKPNTSAAAAELRHRAEAELRALGADRKNRPMMAELCRQAQVRRRKPGRTPRSEAGPQRSVADPQRLLHELQVHQVELEMQNTELQEARDRMEVLLEKYTDLYDFAPVGYFSLDEEGRILEANLTGATLLGVERSRLINRRFQQFVVPTSRPGVLRLLQQVFTKAGKQVGEAILVKADGATFWAELQAVRATSLQGAGKWCRVAVSDITPRKRVEEAHRRTEALTVTNRGLREEIVRRQAVEAALKNSEQHQRQLLEQSRQMHEQLRHLSHQILHVQEAERKRISRELHDVITQTLVGINVHLEMLARSARVNPQGLKRRIVQTQRLVEKSVAIVHQFARELRPTALDDLGLIATLHSFLKDFMKRTGIRVHFTTFAGVDQMDSVPLTVLYRVVQSALTNVAQHAQASRVKVSIQKLPDTVCMEITDNGRSFDVDRILHAKRNKHLGLLGMRERVEMVGGSLSIESTPGQGTTIRAKIPFRSSPARGGGTDRAF